MALFVVDEVEINESVVAMMHSPDTIRPMLYADARRLIVDGDVALYRVGDHGKWSNMLISRIGGTPYVHAGMLYRTIRWGKERLILAETIQWRGGRIIPFSGQVKGWPGQWDIYRPKQPYNARGAVLAMDDIVGRKYGFGALVRASLGHTRYISQWLPPILDTVVAEGAPPFCSQAVSAACRDGGGRDPQPGLLDSVTEPGHLADPAFADYKMTVFFDQIPKDVRNATLPKCNCGDVCCAGHRP